MTLLLLFCITQFEINQAEIREYERSLWEEDFEYIIDEIEENHPFPYRVVTREEIEMAFDDLLIHTDELSDEEVAFQVGRVVALYNDGHTLLSHEHTQSKQFYPIHCQIINGEFYIVNGVDEYRDIFYKKVISMNDILVENIMEDLSIHISAENIYFKEAGVEWRVFNHRVLKYLGVVEEGEDLTLELDGDKGIESRVIKTMLYDEIGKIYDERYESGPDIIGVRNYFYQYDADSKILTFTYNICYDHKKLPFVAFNNQLWDFVEENKVDKIIIDVSRNTGGYDETFTPFLNRLYKSDFNEPNKIFVVIGNRNYSAGTMVVSRLKMWHRAQLIGEPTGGVPVMTYDAVECITPSKGVSVLIATDSFVAYPNHDEDAIYPDTEIIKTIEDYKQDVNPYLEYVKKQ